MTTSFIGTSGDLVKWLNWLIKLKWMIEPMCWWQISAPACKCLRAVSPFKFFFSNFRTQTPSVSCSLSFDLRNQGLRISKYISVSVAVWPLQSSLLQHRLKSGFPVNLFNYELFYNPPKPSSEISVAAAQPLSMAFILPRVTGSSVLMKNSAVLICPS